MTSSYDKAQATMRQQCLDMIKASPTSALAIPKHLRRFIRVLERQGRIRHRDGCWHYALQYVPYEGPAGPSEEQVRENTDFLAEQLTALGCAVERVDDPYEQGVGAKFVKVGDRAMVYDRWGFVDVSCELGGYVSAEELDQVSIDTAIAFLRGKVR